MGLVKYAPKFRVTFYVLAVAVLAVGGVSVAVAPKDVLPDVDIPVVTVIWTYAGLSTPETASRTTTYSEYAVSNNVNGIRDMQSTSLQGVAVQKIYFQADANIDLAIAQVVSAVNSIRALMPPGINLPTLVRYSASSVPVIQLAVSSDRLSEHTRDVGIARDFGTTVELRDGLQGGERVALDPPADLADGQLVRVQAGAPGPDRPR